MKNKCSNKKICLFYYMNYSAFQPSGMFQESINNLYKKDENLLRQLWLPSSISDDFFSDSNISIIQEMIKQDIYIATNKQYRLEVDQDINDLMIVMRGVFLDIAQHLPYSQKKQIKTLNNAVVQ